MRCREPWQHEWEEKGHNLANGGHVKRCTRVGCCWEMLSRPNSNRYRNGPNGEWKHSPKDCEGRNGPALEPHPAASIMAWPKKEKP